MYRHKKNGILKVFQIIIDKEVAMKQLKWVYIGGFVVITAFGLYYYKDILTGNFPPNQTNQQTSSIRSDQATINRLFNIKGMFCDSCNKKLNRR